MNKCPIALKWEYNGEWIVSCDIPQACGELSGFGPTPEKALADLGKLIHRTIEFSEESDCEWWSRIYR